MVRIKFINGAFEKEKERAGIEDWKPYTKRAESMNKAAEAIDRHDDLASLTLSPSTFKQEPGSAYGIKKLRIHAGDDRLLPHQVEATKRFLKELRGFGLLADVVGSGKTFEACSVLSELSAKGKIESLLIIVPDQVYETWIEVLEMGFGLGKGRLKKLGKTWEDDAFEQDEMGIFHPLSPMIVKMEDFICWKENYIKNVLFDAVVVDEAHNLCQEEGPESRALKLLSIMMETKKFAKKSYCLLLSATPHQGSLQDMFRLWYFIRCQGGLPSDFDEKSDEQRTEDYRKEKAYYKDHICRGATTVMEFINKVRLAEVTGTFKPEFDSFLAKRGVENFDALLEGEQKNYIEEFLAIEENEELSEDVNNRIADAYHNGVLRSIMIRQPNDRIRKSKRIENVFLFPATNKAKEFNIQGLTPGESITVYPYELETEKAVKTEDGTFSIKEYVERYRGYRSYREAYADLFWNEGILKAFGISDASFIKQDSVRFYWDQFDKHGVKSDSDDVGVKLQPIYDGDVFKAKMIELKKILDKCADQRVLIFFDYDAKEADRCYDKVIEDLSKDAKYSKRIIIGKETNKDVTEKEFKSTERSNAILIVKDKAFTEGANLQVCNVIVNFQVTPNPVAMEQRVGRIFRLGQENDVTIYSLANMCDLEGYVLMYFTNIGLMTSNDGDAAIIAGSNNDNMVTIRCRACGSVKLLAKEDYEAFVKNDNDLVYCADTPQCRQESPRGTLMSEINSHEIQCTNCKALITRENSEGGGQYHCFARNNTGTGVLCNNGEKGDKQLYCRKICVLSHCKKFNSGILKDKCPALTYYKKTKGQALDSELYELCETCKNKTICSEKCRLGKEGVDAIKSCMTCMEAECRPNPHVINFDDKWEAVCPKCGGKLKPIVARTFETYIRSAYDYQQDKGASFCSNLEKEVYKVAQIQAILSNDEE